MAAKRSRPLERLVGRHGSIDEPPDDEDDETDKPKRTSETARARNARDYCDKNKNETDSLPLEARPLDPNRTSDGLREWGRSRRAMA